MLTFTQKLPDNQAVVHGTALSWLNQGLLLVGPSGVGKSDLALRLMDKGAMLIADDQVNLTFEPRQIKMACPAEIKNKMEVFGIGILPCITLSSAIPLSFVCSLERICPERFPGPSSYTVGPYSTSYTCITLDPFWPSTPQKLKLFLQARADTSP